MTEASRSGRCLTGDTTPARPARPDLRAWVNLSLKMRAMHIHPGSFLFFSGGSDRRTYSGLICIFMISTYVSEGGGRGESVYKEGVWVIYQLKPFLSY